MFSKIIDLSETPMRFVSGVSLYPRLLGIMVAFSLMGCFGGPVLSNPFYKFYEKASAIDNFDDRDVFLKSLSDIEICEVVVLSEELDALHTRSKRCRTQRQSRLIRCRRLYLNDVSV